MPPPCSKFTGLKPGSKLRAKVVSAAVTKAPKAKGGKKKGEAKASGSDDLVTLCLTVRHPPPLARVDGSHSRAPVPL